MSIFEKLRIFGGKKPAAPALREYDDPPFPMLPRFVVERAVDGGWPFGGNIGPQQILDIRLFRALAKGRATGHVFMKANDLSFAEGDEAAALEMAHKAYEFYLDFDWSSVKDHDGMERAAGQARAFWSKLLRV